VGLAQLVLLAILELLEVQERLELLEAWLEPLVRLEQ
jgi:hypothetical protein